MRTDIYQKVTDIIVVQLEKGVRPWFQPWKADHAAGKITKPLRGNGVPYRGINIIMLWSAAVEKDYSAPIWLTFKQAHELGAHVRKGEHGSLVVYANSITRTEIDEETGEETTQEIPFMKGYTVFNVEQIEGLPVHFYAPAETVLDPVQRIEHAERFFADIKAEIRHGGNRAYYSLTTDHIQMPPFETFRDTAAYYGTLAHESAHWTRHPSRLGRDFGRKKWGDEGYAQEELIAEITAAYLSADLGLAPEPREEHAAYLASWLEVLKADKRAIFTFAAHAQRAADYLHGLQPAPAER